MAIGRNPSSVDFVDTFSRKGRRILGVAR